MHKTVLSLLAASILLTGWAATAHAGAANSGSPPQPPYILPQQFAPQSENLSPTQVYHRVFALEECIGNVAFWHDRVARKHIRQARVFLNMYESAALDHDMVRAQYFLNLANAEAEEAARASDDCGY